MGVRRPPQVAQSTIPLVFQTVLDFLQLDLSKFFCAIDDNESAKLVAKGSCLTVSAETVAKQLRVRYRGTETDSAGIHGARCYRLLPADRF